LRAKAKHDAGVGAECLLAAQGYYMPDDTDPDDDRTDTDLARAYAGAIMQAEALFEIRTISRNLVTLIKALTNTR
jgi:hypothetical protein